jgi:tetratricopeptide (TPR) repeat protein
MRTVFRITLASIGMALTLASATALAEGGPPTVELALDPNFVAAKEAIAVKDWEKAVYRLKYVRTEAAEVYNLSGFANRKLGKMDEAFRNYKIALQMEPNHRGAHEYVGEAYLMTNNPAMAEQHLAALERICGKNCEEYKDLEREIAEYKKRH